MSSSKAVGRHATSFARAHRDELADLPSEGRWTARDVDVSYKDVIAKAVDLGLIEVVGSGERYLGGNTRQDYLVYSTTDKLKTAMSRAADPKITLPCGHTGFKNVGDGVYECKREHCQRKYDRDTIEVSMS